MILDRIYFYLLTYLLTYLLSVVHSAILFDSPCTQGSQQLKNEKCNISKSGLYPRIQFICRNR